VNNERGIEADLQAVKRVFTDYSRMRHVKKKELIKIEEERQDLLHVLELGNLNAVEQSRITKELKEVSLRRRQIKNNLEVLEIVNKFSHAFNNNSNKDKQIETVINTVKNSVSKKRTYSMRVRKDLQELVD